MKITCGWAEFIDPVRWEIVARGSLSADALPGTARGPCDGEVRLIRGDERRLIEEGSRWLLRFEKGSAHRWIEMRALEHQWAPSGLRAVAYIRSGDEEIPPAIDELGGE